MRNLLILMVAGLIVVSSSASVWAGQGYDPKAVIHQTKARQKAERKALGVKHKAMKQYLKSQSLSKATKVQMLHQAEREKRDLRQKQKDELEKMKDSQRIARESEKAYR